MKKTYKVNNIACGNCANLIKVSLEDKFGKIEINLDIEPKELTINIEDNTQESELKSEMLELGFEIIEE